MKKVYADENYCVNCHLCKVACFTAHSRSKDIVKAHKKEAGTTAARVRVEEQRPRSFAVQCRHCEDPLCVRACISGAMVKDPETGIVYNDLERCVGCWSCVVACPNGAIVRFEANGKKVALKCDLCRETGTPACVEMCPNAALVFEDRGGKDR